MNDLKFEKYSDGLIPAIVQNVRTGRKHLWTKGETSGNYLEVSRIATDCDGDTLLINATPNGPVCHTGRNTCFGDEKENGLAFLHKLGIRDRVAARIGFRKFIHRLAIRSRSESDRAKGRRRGR